MNELAFVSKRNDIDKALKLLDDAARLSVANNYKKGTATNYLYEAGIYEQNGYSKNALPLYYKSLELSKAIDDTFNVARANQQIAKALMDGNDLTEAEKLFKEAMANYKILNRRDDLVNIENYLGRIKLQQKDYVTAEKYFSEALRESKEVAYGYGLKKANYYLGVLYLEKNNLPKAKVFLSNALTLDEQKNDKYGLSLAKIKLSVVACKEKHYEEAVKLAKSALQDAHAISAMQLEIEAVETLKNVYNYQKNYEKVIEWQEVLIDQQKQIYDKERSFALQFLDILKKKQEEQLAFEKQVLQAEHKARFTYLILSIVGLGLVILSVLAYVCYRNYLNAKIYSKELAAKNAVIEENALMLRELNKAISIQNTGLAETNQMKNKLFSIISHDLRAPFSSVKGVLGLIQSRSMSDDEIKRVMGLLNRELEVAMGMLHNLFVWAKAQLEGSVINLEPINLYNLAEENIEFALSQARQKNISLINAVPTNALALADKERLSFVLRNLLMNAIKFTYGNGEISIHTEDLGDKVAIAVTDNGKGIAPSNLNKLFTEQRFTSLGTAKEKGTGLGLMLCKDFVESLGGTITVKSTEGEGSTFFVVLHKALQADIQETAESRHQYQEIHHNN
ncbi:ATP-binding protein [Pontibacter silvestris]|uniref:histidine kinase n=1 Tax=Pontibacter silvestris TaxID=2305183 RepID=A0ABW4WV13_9BACT|nr:HAMP domain-containing sensor histidine kinase [Pontibacter silvestris]MCC9137978.1 hypothetical protein [Pontibacter silvestris]